MEENRQSIFQEILFPDLDIVGEEQLYYHCDKGCVCAEQAGLEIKAGSYVDFHSYFNAFSCGKWHQYTEIDSVSLWLELKGTVEVIISHNQFIYGGTVQRHMKKRVVTAGTRRWVEIVIGGLETPGDYSFALRAHKNDATLYRAYYGGNCKKREVSLAVCFTTYRREQDMRDNLERIGRVPDAGLHVYVVDNGNSLSLPESERYTVIPNRNVGGAGGFARGMLQAFEDAGQYAYTHVVLMDDDVVCDPRILVRLVCFLGFVKKEYRDSFVGGAMLRRDIPYFHVESGAVRRGPEIRGYGYGLDMRKPKDFMRLDMMRHSDYNAWWFCAIPIHYIRPDNLPLPVFFQWDDVEFGIRNQAPVITLNGICTWHDAFDNKMSALYSYYVARNPLIVSACLEGGKDKKRIVQFVKKNFFTELFLYRYANAEAVLKGVEDFLKGADWLSSYDQAGYHKELCGIRNQEKDRCEIDYDWYQICCNIKDCDKLHGFVRKLTLNGYLLPVKNEIVAPYGSKNIAQGYRAAKILFYDEITGRGYECNRDWEKALECYKRYRRVSRRLKRNFGRVGRAYRNHYPYLCSKEMWDKLLKTE